MDNSVPHRPIALDYPASTRAAWQPRRPEFSAACNALSLGLPYGEPYVMKSIRDALPALESQGQHQLAHEVRGYLDQEAEHARQHRRFNAILREQHPGVRHVEGWLKRTYSFLTRRAGHKFGVAFAAGFEATAFAAARWMDANRQQLFDGADTVPSTLFLWHLAEEVEHKTVAHDVWAATDGNRLRYFAAMVLCFAMLLWFILLGVIVQLCAWRRILNPVAWFRLWVWGFGFFFEAAPTMASTLMPSHHPNNQADPAWMRLWLSAYDPTTNTIPAWNAPIDDYVVSPSRILSTSSEPSSAPSSSASESMTIS